MFKKLLFCMILLMTLNSKVYSIGYISYAKHACNNSCKPTAILVGLASLGILLKEKDQDLILPLVGATALSAVTSGGACLISLFFGKTIPVLRCGNDCSISDILTCNQHTPNDSIKHAICQSLRQHSHRLGCLVGLLTAGSVGYLYQNYSA